MLIVGGGPAGVATAEAAARARRLSRSRSPATSPGCPYDRVGLTDHLAGHRAATDLPLHTKRWYLERGIELCGAVVDVDTERASPRSPTARPIAYDALVLATGSRAFLPPIDGHRARDRRSAPATTCARSAGARNGARRAVVIGGGLLGLEAARAVANRGIAVTVVHLAAA